MAKTSIVERIVDEVIYGMMDVQAVFDHYKELVIGSLREEHLAV